MVSLETLLNNIMLLFYSLGPGVGGIRVKAGMRESVQQERNIVNTKLKQKSINFFQ